MTEPELLSALAQGVLGSCPTVLAPLNPVPLCHLLQGEAAGGWGKQ